MSDREKMMEKSALRRQLNLALKKLGYDEKIRQSKKITQKVLNDQRFHKAKSVSIYLNMDDEVQTEDLLIEVFKQGKECFIPRFKFGNPEMEMIRLPTLEDYFKLPKNKWNIKQPLDDYKMDSVFAKGELDLVLTPGLGFTLNGERLGRGKGYYDKFFQRCQRELKSFPYLVGLAYNEQILTEIPTTDYDVKLNVVYNADP